MITGKINAALRLLSKTDGNGILPLDNNTIAELHLKAGFHLNKLCRIDRHRSTSTVFHLSCNEIDNDQEINYLRLKENNDH